MAGCESKGIVSQVKTGRDALAMPCGPELTPLHRHRAWTALQRWDKAPSRLRRLDPGASGNALCLSAPLSEIRNRSGDAGTVTRPSLCADVGLFGAAAL